MAQGILVEFIHKQLRPIKEPKITASDGKLRGSVLSFQLDHVSYKAKNKHSEVLSGRDHSLTERSTSQQKRKAGVLDDRTDHIWGVN